MFNAAVWLAIPTFIFAIVIMWESMNSMLSGKSISDFLSFFLLGLALAFYTGAIMFSLLFAFLWVILEFAILLSLIWILVNIWREGL